MACARSGALALAGAAVVLAGCAQGAMDDKAMGDKMMDKGQMTEKDGAKDGMTKDGMADKEMMPEKGTAPK